MSESNGSGYYGYFYARDIGWDMVSVLALPDAQMTMDSLANKMAQWRSINANALVISTSTPFMFQDADNTSNLGVMITTFVGTTV